MAAKLAVRLSVELTLWTQETSDDDAVVTAMATFEEMVKPYSGVDWEITAEEVFEHHVVF